MGVYTFICRNSKGEWNARQYSGDLEGSAGSTYDLQRRLVNVALAAEGSGPVQSSFSYVTPSSAVFQVIIGGGGGFVGGGAAVPAATGGAAAAPAEPPAEEKKEEKEEESDEDMGFSLFD